MPTYDYECKKCGHKWEAFQSIKADPLKKCPECKKAGAQRVIGPGAAILFKGSGFYLTDYRSDSYKKAAEADKKSSEPAKSESKGSDSKSSDSKASSSKSSKSSD
ncbi:MAG: zinc ribbon domain-containing protein [Planctomycetaceae bacterium]